MHTRIYIYLYIHIHTYTRIHIYKYRYRHTQKTYSTYMHKHTQVIVTKPCGISITIIDQEIHSGAQHGRLLKRQTII